MVDRVNMTQDKYIKRNYVINPNYVLYIYVLSLVNQPCLESNKILI